MKLACRRLAATALPALALSACAIFADPTLRADIPLAEGVHVTELTSGAGLTSLSAESAEAAGRREFPSMVGMNPTVRFLNFVSAPGRGTQSGPTWVIFSTDLPAPPLIGDGRPRLHGLPSTTMTGLYLSADGKYLGASSESRLRGAP